MAKKIVKIMGGLGNQMFQYAFAYALSKKFDAELSLDLGWFEKVKTKEDITTRGFEINAFNISYDVATEEDLKWAHPQTHRSKIKRFLWKYFKIREFKPDGNILIQTDSYNYDSELFSYPDYLYYEGYFQNEKYFKHERQDLLKYFSLKEPLDEKNQSVLDVIKSVNSISLHIRRGDYVSLESASKFHGTCSLEYYADAIKYIAKKSKNPHFFLFSDDIAWVVENLKIEYPYTVVDFNDGKGHLDMELMKNCKHNIVANSSFSWWGAWLNQNSEKIVIAPKKWTNKKTNSSRIIPNEWVKL